MANPQAENGHIDVSNEIAEALMRTNLSAYQTRILWVIWRQTWGWHKKKDLISVSQIEKKTGLKHSHISRTLKELEQRNIITRTYIGTNRQKRFISFQKNYEKWKLVPNKVRDKTRTYSGSTRTSTGTKLVPIQDLHLIKENKETRQKKGAAIKSHSIPKNFQITPEMTAWFKNQNFKYISIETATEEFIDYWISTGGKKTDWVATWRNGMRKAEAWAKRDNGDTDNEFRKFREKYQTDVSAVQPQTD